MGSLALLAGCGFGVPASPTGDGGGGEGTVPDAPVAIDAPLADARVCSATTFPLTFGTSRYRLGDGLTWFESRDECVTRGGRLTIIETVEENTAVSQMLLSSPTAWTWIGLEKQTNEIKKWVDGVALLPGDFTSFNPSTGDPNDDCFDMSASLQRWGDWHCTDPHAYLCECDPMR